MKNTTIRTFAVVVVVVLTFFLLKLLTSSTPTQTVDINQNASTGADVGDTIVKANTSTTTTRIVVTPELKQESKSYLGRDGVYVVQYTDTGFVPKEIQIPRGKSVRFVNVSSKGLRVFSDTTSDPKFIELNQSKTIGKGSTYTFSFVIDGLWAYHNELFQSHRANIVVY